MTNQTIDGLPRELLESFAAYVADSPNAVMRSRAAQLRALLDAPAETEAVHEVQWNSIHGPEGWKVVDTPTYHRCTGPLWDRRITHKPAAQPQGEPVAYADPKAFENFGTLAHLGGLYAREWMWANPAPGLVPLYTEQPAPVAAVMPERRADATTEDHRSWLRGWNTCLDELKRLNPSL